MTAVAVNGADIAGCRSLGRSEAKPSKVTPALRAITGVFTDAAGKRKFGWCVGPDATGGLSKGSF